MTMCSSCRSRSSRWTWGGHKIQMSFLHGTVKKKLEKASVPDSWQTTMASHLEWNWKCSFWQQQRWPKALTGLRSQTQRWETDLISGTWRKQHIWFKKQNKTKSYVRKKRWLGMPERSLPDALTQQCSSHCSGSLLCCLSWVKPFVIKLILI